MGLSNSLYASISGLSTMGNAMSVLGDNVANVNTIAFKSSRSTFQDVLSQSIATAAGSAQIGRGVTLSTVDGLFAQGSFESTSTATDLAIGGEGFFMLRAAGSAQADMYTRAGEFRFDKEGYLINPSGAFVQGWTINSTSGEIQGTIGDINLGKSTPPVASTKVDVIVNVDSRQPNEVTEARLYDAWDGRNAAAAVPSDPIASTAYNYTSAIKVYDSKGAAHDVSIYFDRTTKDNQWEFLVTCPPLEDHRNLTTGVDASGNLNGTNDELTIYAPDTTYNAAKDKGAGALLYGTIDFSVSGEISKISAWNVPPDGKVDPASDVNRITLGSTDQYYTFDTNFTGAATNQAVAINFGATYSGQTTALPQVLVSDNGASSAPGGTTPITKETLWNSVFDATGTQVTNGDTFYFSGYDHSGNAVSGTYTVDTSQKVQALLNQLDTAFSCTATIDAQGRLCMTDKTGGPSGMYVTNFNLVSANNATPFGGSVVTSSQAVVSTAALTTDGTTPAANPGALLNTLWDNSGRDIRNGDIFTFSGTAANNTAIPPTTFTVGTNGNTVQDLLNFLEDLYDDGNATNNSYIPLTTTTAQPVTATLGSDGHIRIVDNTGGGHLAVTVNSTATTTAANGQLLLLGATYNSTTPSSPLYTDAAKTKPITAAAAGSTLLTSVYDNAGNRMTVGDAYTFGGTDNGGVAITPFSYTVGATDTVQSFITLLQSKYGGTVGVNASGQLTFTGGTSVSATTYTPVAADPLAPAGTSFSAQKVYGTEVNITTSKQQIVSPGRAVTTSTGNVPVITANTDWGNVYDSSGKGPVTTGDSISFTGTRGDGTAVSGTFYVNGTTTDSYGPPLTAASGKVNDLLFWLENKFNAEASIDGDGRLVLTDRTANEPSGYSSKLSISSVSNTGLATNLFGPSNTTFATIPSDLTKEDGSFQGETTSVDFNTEALASTQYANSSTTIFQNQNGFAAGFLQSVSVDTTGVITGNYSNGQVLKKAQVALASFNNVQGLRKEGGNIFRETTQSGAPVTGAPGTNGLGSISPNSLEQSNVDLGTEFVKLITTQRGFQANSKVITTTDDMLSDLINIKR